ncbi:unnamed protein product [Rotaria sp. Silwood2]|nr:unnamed protein product [Rotaria sp. Silwood2]CAF2942233.1 unnamed protein product [Rotaria sp. Silwood2]CAF3868536.1 unnamed protein product [Rotaria sp. Silwood2]CAF4093535.1 unnamed protein product [Rotaria sp. Silwood2]CAF4239374.1 unnamed protein product [Rotaria sp. Silwood2]
MLFFPKGHIKIVEYLIEKIKLEVDTIGDRRLTPLHVACENGYLNIVEYLLEKHASTTLRNARCYNCLEIAVTNKQAEIVKKLFDNSTWREMMRNAQPIDNSAAYDTPMRKLIRYLPDVAVWVIENKLTSVIGGPGQKIYKTVYDYEFYEDMCAVKDWYTKASKDCYIARCPVKNELEKKEIY